MSQMIPRTVVSEVTGYREAALKKMRQAAEMIAEGHRLAEEARDLGKKAGGGTDQFYFKRRDQSEMFQRMFLAFSSGESLEAYRQNLDACVWQGLLKTTGMFDMLDKTAKDEIYDSLCSSEGVPEATEENIYGTFREMLSKAQLFFQRGLARSFVKLDRRFKSHDGFKLGSRVVLTYVFDQFGHWNYGSRMDETIADIERVFAVLDGQTPAMGALRTAIDQDRQHNRSSARQSLTETPLFKVRCYQNGNAHLWFKRTDLVERANAILADYYGEVLPDAVPRHEDPKVTTTAMVIKDLSFYPTPDAVVKLLLRDVGVKEARVLEPSAGTGNIVRHLLAEGAAQVDAVEIAPERVAVLKLFNDPRLSVTQANFLQMRPVPEYDVVAMNPPFYGTHWMEHVAHAFEFLKPGGRLVSVLPVTAELGDSKKHEDFRKWAQNRRYMYGRNLFSDLPDESFAETGTRISTVVLTLWRQS